MYYIEYLLNDCPYSGARTELANHLKVSPSCITRTLANKPRKETMTRYTKAFNALHETNYRSDQLFRKLDWNEEKKEFII